MISIPGGEAILDPLLDLERIPPDSARAYATAQGELASFHQVVYV
jgi:hypothetical protein